MTQLIIGVFEFKEETEVAQANGNYYSKHVRAIKNE